MRKAIAYISILLFLSGAITPLNAVETDSLSYPWGTIIFHPGEKELARSSAEKIRVSLGRIGEMLDLEQQYQFEVVIAKSKEAFLKFAGRLPEWAGAVANYRTNRIVLKSPSLGKTDIWDYDETLMHEVAHMIIGQNLDPDRLPRWFNEGLAMAAAGQHSLQDSYTLAMAAVREDLIPLGELEQMLNFHRKKASLGYAQSYSVVQFLQSKFPAETLPRVFRRMQKSDLSFSQALQEIAGVSSFYLEYHWKQELQSQYKWISVLSSDTVLWIIFPVLALLGYLAVKWRNRKKMQQWESEEDRIDSELDWDYEYLPDEDDKWRGDIH